MYDKLESLRIGNGIPKKWMLRKKYLLKLEIMWTRNNKLNNDNEVENYIKWKIFSLSSINKNTIINTISIWE